MSGAEGISYAVAAGATVWLIAHVARLHAAAPARLPLRVDLEGRPSRATVGKWILWLPPGVLASALVMLGILRTADLRGTTRAGDEPMMVLIYVVFAYVAWAAAWALDRQVAVAREPAVRFAPVTTLWVALPILVLIAAIAAVAPPQR